MLFKCCCRSQEKTTLVDALSKHLRLHFPEISLGVIKEAPRVAVADHTCSRDETRKDPDQIIEWQELVLEAQLDEERRYDTKQFLIFAGSGIDPIIRAMKTLPKKNFQALLDGAAWTLLRARMMDLLIVVCEPGAGSLTDDEWILVSMEHEDQTTCHN